MDVCGPMWLSSTTAPAPMISGALDAGARHARPRLDDDGAQQLAEVVDVTLDGPRQPVQEVAVAVQDVLDVRPVSFQ